MYRTCHVSPLTHPYVQHVHYKSSALQHNKIDSKKKKRLILTVLYAHIVTHKLNEGVQLIWFILKCRENILQGWPELDNVSEHNFIFVSISNNRISHRDDRKIGHAYSGTLVSLSLMRRPAYIKAKIEVNGFTDNVIHHADFAQGARVSLLRRAVRLFLAWSCTCTSSFDCPCSSA